MSSPHNHKTILCFDFGTQNIGVAIGQTITHSASSLSTLKANDGIPNWKEVEDLIKQWQPDLLLIGQPLNMDGSHSAMTARAEKFSRRLHGRFGLPTEMADERLSSFEAKGEILKHGKQIKGHDVGHNNFKERNVDSIAARIILDSWLAEQAPFTGE